MNSRGHSRTETSHSSHLYITVSRSAATYCVATHIHTYTSTVYVHVPKFTFPQLYCHFILLKTFFRNCFLSRIQCLSQRRHKRRASTWIRLLPISLSEDDYHTRQAVYFFPLRSFGKRLQMGDGRPGRLRAPLSDLAEGRAEQVPAGRE